MKRQRKKRVNAATHDPTHTFLNKGPTAKSNSSDEEDSRELKMTIADTRKKNHCAQGDNPWGSK